MATSSVGTPWLAQLNADLRGSDRACAVLAGAILDERLLQLIAKALLPSGRKGDDRLLGRGGALESFAVRIELCRRLNLVASEVSRSLDWLREIRNDAAHRELFTFEDSSTKDRVNNIVGALELRARGPGLLSPPYDDTKGNFVASVAMLVTRVQLEAETLKPIHHEPLGNAAISIGA